MKMIPMYPCGGYRYATSVLNPDKPMPNPAKAAATIIGFLNRLRGSFVLKP